MKVYLALQYYDNGQPLEDHWSDTDLIGVYSAPDAAMDAVDRMIEDQHTDALSINIDSDQLPGIVSVSPHGTNDIQKYRAMIFRNTFGEDVTWQYYILAQEVLD